MGDIKAQVQHIINTLENPPLLCEDCGHTWDAEVASKCPECASVHINVMTAYDYLQDALDIEWTLGSDKQLLGARVVVCFGGPTVVIDTRHSRVEGYWRQDNYTEVFGDRMGLEEALEDIYNC